MPDKPQTPAQPPTRSIPLSEPQKWRAFWVCIAVAAITILDLSKVNVALPSIEQALGSSSTALQLIETSSRGQRRSANERVG